MSRLEVTEEFLTYINDACSSYKRGWCIIQKGHLLDEIFLNYIESHNLDPIKCEETPCSISGAPKGLTSWKNVISVIKKLKSMQSTCATKSNNNSELESLAKEISRQSEVINKLNAQISKYDYILQELSDKIYTLQQSIPNILNNKTTQDEQIDNMRKSLGTDPTDSNTINKLKDATLDDFDSIIKNRKSEKHISSKGVIDTHVVHSAESSFKKGNEVSNEPEYETSIVYDTHNPNMTQREAEFIEAKKILEDLRKEKDAPIEHPLNSDDEKHDRWLKAIQKNRIIKDMGVDTDILNKSGFDVNDPENSIFK